MSCIVPGSHSLFCGVTSTWKSTTVKTRKQNVKTNNFVRCVRGLPFVPFVHTFRTFFYVWPTGPTKRTYICERTNILCFQKRKHLQYVSMKRTFVDEGFNFGLNVHNVRLVCTKLKSYVHDLYNLGTTFTIFAYIVYQPNFLC